MNANQVDKYHRAEGKLAKVGLEVFLDEYEGHFSVEGTGYNNTVYFGTVDTLYSFAEGVAFGRNMMMAVHTDEADPVTSRYKELADDRLVEVNNLREHRDRLLGLLPLAVLYGNSDDSVRSVGGCEDTILIGQSSTLEGFLETWRPE